MATGQHLHLDDYPHTLAILATLFARRSDGPDHGYETTEHGAVVDWEALEHGPLSSAERAAVVGSTSNGPSTASPKRPASRTAP